MQTLEYIRPTSYSCPTCLNDRSLCMEICFCSIDKIIQILTGKRRSYDPKSTTQASLLLDSFSTLGEVTSGLWMAAKIRCYFNVLILIHSFSIIDAKRYLELIDRKFGKQKKYLDQAFAG